MIIIELDYNPLKNIKDFLLKTNLSDSTTL